jgi:16S rRNA (cytidine1402-2'-O)-methyltransferase
MSTLFLIPTPLGEQDVAHWMLPAQAERLRPLTHFVVEAAKTARKHLKQLALDTPLQHLQLAELNEHTPERELDALLAPLNAGHDMGLMSEAGCPAVADPGAGLVRLAHARGHVVEPLIGPSSLLLALMASGANGQRFAFHGYLPVAENERIAALRKLEQESRERDCAQLFIETPYRNQTLLATLRQTLKASTLLTAACDLTLPTQTIISRRVKDWPTPGPDLHKRPAIFVLYAGK